MLLIVTCPHVRYQCCKLVLGSPREPGVRSLSCCVARQYYSIVVPRPTLDEHLGFQQRIEPFAVEELIAELTIEALDGAIFPGAAQLDEQGLDLDAS